MDGKLSTDWLKNEHLSKVKCVIKGGKLLMNWLKCQPKVKCVIDDGKLSTDWLKL